MKRYARLSFASAGLVATCAAMPGCTDHTDSSTVLDANPPSSGDAESTASLTMPCVQDQGDLGATTRKYKGGAELYSIDTNWCFAPKRAGELRVLFIIDRSGSMSVNDPEGAGGCGRLNAVRSYIDT